VSTKSTGCRVQSAGYSPASLVLAMALFIAACTSGDGSQAAYSVRDSAGIRIVENEAPWEGATLFQVSATPLVDIGVLEGDEVYQLFRVGGVVRLNDGRIVVANGGTYELRFFDAEGRYLLSVGHEGDGPGEFRGLERIAVVCNSIVVFDWSLGRLSVFDFEGNYVRSARVQGEHTSPLGAFANGRWLFTAGFSFVPSPVSKVVRDTTLFVIVGPDGVVTDTVGRFPRVEFFVVGDARQARAHSLLYGRTTLQAVSGNTAYIGPTDRYEIFRYGVGGQLDMIVRKEHEDLVVRTADVDVEKQRMLEDAFNDDWRQTLERMFLDMPIPATMPAFDGLQVDGQGNLWVGEYRRPSDPQPRWTVFAADGHVLGTVETPPGLTIHQIGDDFILGTWEDEMEVEHVRLYGLDRRQE